MPDTTYLHIQGRESDPTRVVAMPGAAVRVGRGPQCEVRLPEPDLAEVQCILRRRGDSWQIQPVGPSHLIMIEGQPVEHLRSWPFGVPLHVGTHRLVIPPAQGGTYQAPFEVGERFHAQRAVYPRPVPPSIDSASRAEAAKPAPSNSEAEVERLRRWQAQLEQRERWLQTRQDEKKWESRWRAAGEGLRARSAPATPPRPDLSKPAVSNPPRPFGMAPVTGERVVSPLPTARPSARIVKPKEPRSQTALPRTLPPPVTPPVVPDEPSLATKSVPEIESDSVRRTEAPIEPLIEVPSDAPVEALVVDETATETEIVLPTERFIPELDPCEPAWSEPSTIVVEMEAEETFADQAEPIGLEPQPEIESPREPVVRQQPQTAPPRDDYPSAAAIFAAQGTRAASRFATDRRSRRGPMPTEARAPAEWVMPVWLGGPPTAIVAMGLMGVGLILGLFWSRDNMAAGLAAKSALRLEQDPPAPIDPTYRPETAWWKTTAGHLAQWAVAIERSPEAHERVDEIRDLIHSASRAAPLQSEIKLARAQDSSSEAPKTPSTALGLSRDVVSLTLEGRVLKQSGQVEPAIRAYRSAIELATEADPTQLDPPVFDEDPQVRRFCLPHEGLIRSVVRDMLDAGEWRLDEWSQVVPSCPLARLAVARTLRERGMGDAEKLLDLVLTEDASLTERTALAAENLAARAEALAFKGRKSEAAEGYRKAIELVTDDMTRRRWRLGLAEILGPLGATQERAEMLEAAKSPDPTEDVTRKAIDAQKLAGLK